jgi:hypothetical protein
MLALFVNFVAIYFPRSSSVLLVWVLDCKGICSLSAGVSQILLQLLKVFVDRAKSEIGPKATIF